MKIAIAGGTGTLGRLVAGELRVRGHEVRVLSRGAPEYRVDLTTGAGLDEALVGCEVVVDASNNSSRTAAATLVDGTRRLLAAGQAAGVAHHVCVSIVGCELVPQGYFAAKAKQEDLVAGGTVPWTIVRATQFHEYVAALLAAGARWRALPVPRALVQPVACADVARTVAGAAERAARHGQVAIAGPDVVTARELAWRWRRATGTRAVLVPLDGPGADPADRVTLDESVSMALLVVLETLSPAERTAFVLHDVFGVEFTEIAGVVGRSPAAVRQLASRARRHVQGDRPRFPPTRAQQRELVAAFTSACYDGDLERLMTLLDPEVTWRADGGGAVRATPPAARGARQIARVLLGFARRPPRQVRMALVNGSPGLVLTDADGVLTVLALTADAGRITAIDVIRDPAKLGKVDAALTGATFRSEQ